MQLKRPGQTCCSSSRPGSHQCSTNPHKKAFSKVLSGRSENTHKTPTAMQTSTKEPLRILATTTKILQKTATTRNKVFIQRVMGRIRHGKGKKVTDLSYILEITQFKLCNQVLILTPLWQIKYPKDCSKPVWVCKGSYQLKKTEFCE